MDKIKEYYKLCDIKLEVHKLVSPFYRPSMKKIKLTQKELELYYKSEFGIFIPDPQDRQ